jgi:hypothetical protein
MQVGEHHRGQLGGWRTSGCEPVAEPAHQRLDGRSVAEETGTEPGVNDGVAIAGPHALDQLLCNAPAGRPAEFGPTLAPMSARSGG